MNMPEAYNGHNFCRVYWGSHGCIRERGHKGHHWCSCCQCTGEHTDEVVDGVMCVASYPYYGPETVFYGEDYVIESSTVDRNSD